jgi:4-hydroxy-3-methylbut-2-enyl diphosphate reductase
MFNPGPALRTTEIPAAPGEGQKLPRLHVILAAPRGFCAGVERAIAAVEEALTRVGAPV